MTEKGHSRKKQYTEKDDRLFLYLPIAVIVIYVYGMITFGWK